jgi:hypothetical protein
VTDEFFRTCGYLERPVPAYRDQDSASIQRRLQYLFMQVWDVLRNDGPLCLFRLDDTLVAGSSDEFRGLLGETRVIFNRLEGLVARTENVGRLTGSLVILSERAKEVLGSIVVLLLVGEVHHPLALRGLQLLNRALQKMGDFVSAPDAERPRLAREIIGLTREAETFRRDVDNSLRAPRTTR